jgi:hypothetical protein
VVRGIDGTIDMGNVVDERECRSRVNNEFPFSAGFVLSSGLTGLKNEIDRLRVREVKWKD